MKKRILDLQKRETKTLGITTKEWMGLLVSIFVLMVPVIASISVELSLWRKGLTILFMGGWFGFVLYCLLFITKSTREQDREEELINSIEDYFMKAMDDDESVDTVIDELRNWANLPEEIKYKRDKETNH